MYFVQCPLFCTFLSQHLRLYPSPSDDRCVKCFLPRLSGVSNSQCVFEQFAFRRLSVAAPLLTKRLSQQPFEPQLCVGTKIYSRYQISPGSMLLMLSRLVSNVN